MNFFGTQINPLTLSIVAVLLILACALPIIFLARRERIKNTTYAVEFDFFGGVGNRHNGEQSETGDLQIKQLGNGIVQIEEEILEPVELPVVSEDALA